LVRAYGGAAAECLRTAPRQPLLVTTRLVLACVFDDLGVVHAALAPHLATKLQESFNENGALLTLELPADRVDALKSHLRDATRNRVHVVPATA
jgi:putative IMPACT (imprinted ancient) family translation regulator